MFGEKKVQLSPENCWQARGFPKEKSINHCRPEKEEQEEEGEQDKSECNQEEDGKRRWVRKKGSSWRLVRFRQPIVVVAGGAKGGEGGESGGIAEAHEDNEDGHA